MRDLNAAILTLAPKHVARAHVPSFNDKSLWHALQQYETAEGFLVFDGASDHTIWGDARVNHAFRAWHDAVHLRIRAGFTLDDERAVCEMQCRELMAMVPSAPCAWCDIIRADVTCQAEHFTVHGVFPVDQRAFILQHLEGRS